MNSVVLLPVAGMVLGMPAMLLLGLSSSPHCALMCAPMTQLAGRGAKPLLMLHLGRLSAYAILGAAAGGIGAALLMLLQRYHVDGLLRWLAAAALLGLGIVQWRKPKPLPTCCGSKPAAGLARQPAFVRGLLWGLLPCPLLWAVLALVTLSGDAVQAAMLILSFGLGTSPLLLTMTGIGNRIAGKIPDRYGRRSAAVMLALGGIWIAATTPLVAGTIAGFCFAGL
ncbi:MAG: hypothetical protein JWQ90_3809 [Hydrocarboniphaga sp.]|uniref:sulfite exporter TauE/SafE family protein n=1 Tax=Hydrocarboniphaga sp. TaxID=2033016 RepID=UPI00261D7F94|nr:sulfite exporter TauE/SafE family protein [Hydrocarboniphaga sp.]MDB5971359.1 hypothetical protein [Hydrocarboniphaga sp.]